MRIVHASFAAVLTLALGIGCSDKPPEPQRQPSVPPPVAGAKLDPPDFVVTAKEFADEYAKDKAAFAAKYKEKTIEVTGVAFEVTASVISNDAHVMLEGNAAPGSTGIEGKVLCFTSERRPWNLALPGQTVKLRGRQPNPIHAAVYECVVVEATGDGPPTVSIDDLAKEHVANDDAASKKWKRKTVIVTGKFVKSVDGKYGKQHFFETPTNRSFSISFRLDGEIATADKLKPGQEVRILGEYSYYSKEDGVVLGEGRFLGSP